MGRVRRTVKGWETWEPVTSHRSLADNPNPCGHLATKLAGLRAELPLDTNAVSLPRSMRYTRHFGCSMFCARKGSSVLFFSGWPSGAER